MNNGEHRESLSGGEISNKRLWTTYVGTKATIQIRDILFALAIPV
jgi:hypothetical protein